MDDPNASHSCLNVRSLLFIPGDSEKKLAKGESTAADALVLDLEDSVSHNRLRIARELVKEYLAHRAATRTQQIWIRVNALSTSKALADLTAVIASLPDGILLPKVDSAEQVILLDHYLSALEAYVGIAGGATKIIAVATETPRSMFALGSYANTSKRLVGLTWGAEDLSSAIGATTNRTDAGEYAFSYQLARSLCLFGAHAASIQAIDTITQDFRDHERLRRDVKMARQDGFTGKLAIHPDQVPAINDGFSPNDEELQYASGVVAAFQAADDAGSVQLDGKMLDRPHLTLARRVLALKRRV